MIVQCEKCKTKFTLDDKLIKETGSKVRCSICKTVFTTYPEKQEDDLPSSTIPTPVVEKKIIEDDIDDINIDYNEKIEDVEEEEEFEEDDDREDIEEKFTIDEEDIEEEGYEDENDDDDEEEDDDEKENNKTKNRSNNKYKDIDVDDDFDDEEEFIEKEEEQDIEQNNSLRLDEYRENLKSEKKKQKKKNKSKNSIIALFFTFIMVVATTFSIYYLHTILVKSGKKRDNIINSTISKNSNALIDPSKTMSEKIKTNLRKMLGKEEKFPYILPIPATTNSVQVINNKIGYVKVITGQVINKTKVTYNVIKIKGILSTKENPKIREEIVVCGNMVSKNELRNFSLDDFKKRLYDEKSNEAMAPLRPGEKRRFFMIFYNLPNNLITHHLSIVSAISVKN